MSSDPNLVTTCNFNGRNYFVKMHEYNNMLEILVTDKQTGEDWQCCYEAPYIESITQKTGNFKQFKIFVAMLRSGLLKTSNSIHLDLFTINDLDALRTHRIRGLYSSYNISKSGSNRRYLILTYTAEFDRIHYPIPLEYCGPPDPQILQQTINNLQNEIGSLKEQISRGPPANSTSVPAEPNMVDNLQKRIDDLIEENKSLKKETNRLGNLVESKSSNKSQLQMLQNAIKSLEKSVLIERRSHHELVERLRKDKILLSKELERMKISEKSLMQQLQKIAGPGYLKPAIKKPQSRSPSPWTREQRLNCLKPAIKKDQSRSPSPWVPASKHVEHKVRQEASPSPRHLQQKHSWTSLHNGETIFTRSKSAQKIFDMDGQGDRRPLTSPVPHTSRTSIRRSRTKHRKPLPRSDSEESGKDFYFRNCRSGSSSRASSCSTKRESSNGCATNRIKYSESPQRSSSKTSDIDRNFSSLENRINYLQKIVNDSLY